MTSTHSPYAVGDKVIALHALVAPPEDAWGVGVEIPPGTRGEIIDLRDPRFQRPYLACFDIGHLEIAVCDDDIALLSPAIPRFEPEPVLVVPTASLRKITSDVHSMCEVTHVAQNAMLSLSMAGSVLLQPLRVGLAMAAVLAFLVGCLWWERRRRSYPLMLPNERVVINKRRARWAVLTDVIVTGCALTFVTVLGFQALAPAYVSHHQVFGGGPLYGVIVLFFVAWLFKEEAHRHAVDIVPVSS